MGQEQHIALLIEYCEGRPARELVHVEPIEPGRFRLCYSPGFVQGVAAGDELRVLDEHGAFEVTRRAGNVCVQLFSEGKNAPSGELVSAVEKLGGALDGRIDQGLVFTIPVAVGFANMEATFERWVADHPGWEWGYGNVYDLKDGVTPLNWWTAESPP